jgi:hypothetical protein
MNVYFLDNIWDINLVKEINKQILKGPDDGINPQNHWLYRLCPLFEILNSYKI